MTSPQKSQVTSAVAGKCITLCLVLTLLALIWSCARGEPVAVEGDILTINASPSTILNLGDTSIVTIRMTHSDGRPVPDGVRIQLTSTGGDIINQVTTLNGEARAPFFSDAGTGAVTITAQSGALGAGEESASTMIEVLDGTIEIGSAAVSLNPGHLTRAGGEVLINATLFDVGGYPVAGRQGVVSTQYGRLASNGAPLVTDSQGRISDLLSLSSLPAEVTAVTVTADFGAANATADVTIGSNQPPLAAMSFTPSNPRVGDTVFFNGGPSEDPDGQVVKWAWDFGEGAAAEGREVSHQFTTAREHRVTLRVTDDEGALHAVSEPVVVGDNIPPVAAFTFSPSEPRVGGFITFDAATSTDEDGNIANYTWTMGNGASRVGSVVDFSYSRAGVYTVTLTVTDNEGASHSLGQQVTVAGNMAPNAVFAASTTSAAIGESIQFDAAESSDEDGVIEKYEWDFGDGLSFQGQTVNHQYNRSGSFLVRLTVTDNENAKSFASQTITIAQNQPPVASFTTTPASPRPGQGVTFDASDSSDADGSIRTFRWDFGDGSLGSGQIVQHVYNSAFEYAVLLTVTDNSGGKDTTSRAVNVQVGGIPNANLSVDPSTLPPEGGQVLLDASGSSDSENDGQLSYFFSSNRGRQVTISHSNDRSPQALAAVPPLADGSRVLFEVEVLDRDGNSGIAGSTVVISRETQPEAPVAQLTLTPAQLDVNGGIVTLDAGASTDSDTPFDDLTFDFSAEVAGAPVVEIQSGTFLRRVEIKPGDKPISPTDRVVFAVIVTDPDGLKSRATQTLTFDLATPKMTQKE